MEYIKKIREKVGHDKVLIPSTAVVILNNEHQILLQLRSDSQSWGLPGGLMDLGETVVECAVREAYEETGLRLTRLRLFGIFSGPSFEAKYPNGDETSSVAMGFYTDTYEGTLLSDFESTEQRFFSVENLPTSMNQFQRRFVEGYLKFVSNGNGLPVLT